MLSKIMLVINTCLTAGSIFATIICLISGAFGEAWLWVIPTIYFILNTKALTEIL